MEQEKSHPFHIFSVNLKLITKNMFNLSCSFLIFKDFLSSILLKDFQHSLSIHQDEAYKILYQIVFQARIELSKILSMAKLIEDYLSIVNKKTNEAKSFVKSSV